MLVGFFKRLIFSACRCCLIERALRRCLPEQQVPALTRAADSSVTGATLIAYIVSGVNALSETCRAMNPAELLSFLKNA